MAEGDSGRKLKGGRMRDIIIVGAGHLGLDVRWLIDEINDVSPTWNVLGFLNDIPAELARYGVREKVLGPIKGWNTIGDEAYALAIGLPSAKEHIANMLKGKGAEFPALVSPRAHIHSTAILDEGAIVISTSKIGPCVRVGKFAVVGDSTISVDSKLGDYSNTASYVNIYKNIRVGKRVQLWSQSVILRDVGDDAVVGAGSVVVSPVKPNTTVFGAPARIVSVPKSE